MATPVLQFEYTHPGEADVNSNIASRGAVCSADIDKPDNVCIHPRYADNISVKPGKKKITKSNTIILFAIILMLLITLQVMMISSLHAPPCCESLATTQLTLPPAVEQPIRSAPASSPVPPAPAKRHAIKADVKPAIVTAASAESGPVVAAAASEPVTALSTVAAVARSEPVITVVQEDIQSDAAASLIATTESYFVKLSDSGQALAENEAQWECVHDKSNNLTWEVKKNDGGIRDKDHSYSWLVKSNGQDRGVSNGGRCKGGVDCDTSSYTRAMNEQKLCGYSDWRLPTREELETLVEYNKASNGVTIDSRYFPEAVPSWYWTASENPHSDSYAWYVLFQNGVALNDLKERPKHIRLVRGNPPQ
jgi:hypothetical protein